MFSGLLSKLPYVAEKRKTRLYCLSMPGSAAVPMVDSKEFSASLSAAFATLPQKCYYLVAVTAIVFSEIGFVVGSVSDTKSFPMFFVEASAVCAHPRWICFPPFGVVC